MKSHLTRRTSDVKRGYSLPGGADTVWLVWEGPNTPCEKPTYTSNVRRRMGRTGRQAERMLSGWFGKGIRHSQTQAHTDLSNHSLDVSWDCCLLARGKASHAWVLKRCKTMANSIDNGTSFGEGGLFCLRESPPSHPRRGRAGFGIQLQQLSEGKKSDVCILRR